MANRPSRPARDAQRFTAPRPLRRARPPVALRRGPRRARPQGDRLRVDRVTTHREGRRASPCTRTLILSISVLRMSNGRRRRCPDAAPAAVSQRAATPASSRRKAKYPQDPDGPGGLPLITEIQKWLPRNLRGSHFVLLVALRPTVAAAGRAGVVGDRLDVAGGLSDPT